MWQGGRSKKFIFQTVRRYWKQFAQPEPELKWLPAKREFNFIWFSADNEVSGNEEAYEPVRQGAEDTCLGP